jgi:cold shock CspA family protein
VKGIVVSFDGPVGLGQIVSDGADYPFHCTQIADGSRSIEVGAAVTFEVRPGRLGRWEAAEIRTGSPYLSHTPRS